MELNQTIIEKLADIIMSEGIEWEQPDTCNNIQEALRKEIGPVLSGLVIGLYWDEYIEATLEYIKQEVNKQEC